MEKHCLANLRGLIVSKYKNYSRYAEALGWSRQKLSYKLNNPTSITAKDAHIMANSLGIPLNDQTMQIFLPEK